MKIRQGFVSNSSSSSFSCDVCGEEVSGWDVCLSEAEMSECVNGHVFCNDHMDGDEDKEPDIKELQQYCLDNISDDDKERREEILAMDYDEVYDEAESWGFDDDDPYDVPESKCPICSFLNVHTGEAYAYLLDKIGITEAQLLDELKGRFKNYAELQARIRGNQ